MDKLAKALGERIRTQRKACSISQDALALACNIVVVTGGSIRFARAGLTPWKKALVKVHSEMEGRIGKDTIQAVYKETGFKPD